MERSEAKRYGITGACLAGLTLLTIWLSGLSLPSSLHYVFAYGIAFLKASLIALFFMHLATDKNYRVILIFSLGIAFFLMLALTSDLFLSFHQHSF